MLQFDNDVKLEYFVILLIDGIVAQTEPMHYEDVVF